MGAGHPGGEHPKAKHELLQSTVEIITGICATAAEAEPIWPPRSLSCGPRPRLATWS